MITLCVLFLFLPALVVPAPAQVVVPDIHKLVAQVNEGQSEQVRAQLPTLLTDYPNNPGVLYLQALLTREGADAVRTYQSIVDNFPQNEWADDALYKIYQFYYALGLYSTAQLKLDQLKSSYPASPYVRGASGEMADVNRPARAAEKRADEGGLPVSPGQTQRPVPGREATPEQTPAQPDPTPAQVEPPQVEAEPASPARFTLQVGAFTVHANAEALMSRFESKGYSTEMISKIKDTRSLFIVLVGDYPSYDEAKAATREVKKSMGLDAIVVSR